jgi:hypothetical protein
MFWDPTIVFEFPDAKFLFPDKMFVLPIIVD